MQSESTLKVWTNDTDTIVAADMADVRAVIVELQGGDDYFTEDEWGEVPSSEPITITNMDVEDENGQTTPTKVTKTAGEWAATEGRGLLCSTEY